MWYVIDAAFILAIIILFKIGKRNIIMLLKILKKTSLLFVPMFIIMVIFRAGDKTAMVFEIAFSLLIILELVMAYIIVKRKKFLMKLIRKG